MLDLLTNYQELLDMVPDHTPKQLLEDCYQAANSEDLSVAFRKLGRYVRGHTLILGQRLIQAALQIALDAGNPREVVEALLGLAFTASNLANYDRAMDYIQRALDIVKEHKFYDLEAGVYNVRAITYMGIGDMVGAYHDLHQSIDLASIYKQPMDLASGYNNMAWLEYNQGEGEAALHYINLMKEVVQTLDQESRTYWAAFLYGNRAAAYVVLTKKALQRNRMKSFEEALLSGKAELKKMKASIEELPDALHEGAYYSYVGFFELISGNVDAAEIAATKAIEASQKTGQNFYTDPYKCMAEVCLARGKTQEALDHYNTALRILQSQVRTWEIQEVSKKIIEIHQNHQDYDKALEIAYDCLESSKYEMRRVSAAAQRQILLVRELREVTHKANSWQERLIQAEQMARHDVLTGLLNRLGLHEAQLLLRDHVERKGLYLLVSYLDIDHFKKVNDNFSHSLGDQVLKELGKMLQSILPESGVLGRYGGEEFVLLAPFEKVKEAADFMEYCRKSVENHYWKAVHSDLKLTVSIGYVLTKGVELDQAFLEADECLYEAKNSGRNAVFPAIPKILE